jgi:hypothetical protein
MSRFDQFDYLDEDQKEYLDNLICDEDFSQEYEGSKGRIKLIKELRLLLHITPIRAKNLALFLLSDNSESIPPITNSIPLITNSIPTNVLFKNESKPISSISRNTPLIFTQSPKLTSSDNISLSFSKAKFKGDELSLIASDFSNITEAKSESYYPYPVSSIDYSVYIPPKKEVEPFQFSTSMSTQFHKNGLYSKSSLKWLLSPARTIFFYPPLYKERFILAVRFISSSKTFSKWSVGCCCFSPKHVFEEPEEEENNSNFNFNVMIENFTQNYEPLNMGKTPTSVRYQANGEIVYGSFGYPKGDPWKIGSPFGLSYNNTKGLVLNTSIGNIKFGSSSCPPPPQTNEDDEFFNFLSIKGGQSTSIMSSHINNTFSLGDVNNVDNEVGSVVVVDLDCRNGTIQFFLDGIPQRQTFINVNTLGRITPSKPDEFFSQFFYFFVRAGDPETVVDVVNFGVVSGGAKVEKGVIWGKK